MTSDRNEWTPEPEDDDEGVWLREQRHPSSLESFDNFLAGLALLIGIVVTIVVLLS